MWSKYWSLECGKMSLYLYKDSLFNWPGQILIPGCSWSWAFSSVVKLGIGMSDSRKSSESQASTAPSLIYISPPKLLVSTSDRCLASQCPSILRTRQSFLLYLRIWNFLEAKCSVLLARDKGKTEYSPLLHMKKKMST